MSSHVWSYVKDRPTLDPRTVMGKYGCCRCGSTYEMEILRSEIGRPQDPPSWKDVDPDCDSVVVVRVMNS